MKRAIVSIAAKPRNQVQGALLCFGVSGVLSLLNWGLGLVDGALVAACDRETQCPSGDGLYDRRIRDRVGGVGNDRSDRALRNLTPDAQAKDAEHSA